MKGTKMRKPIWNAVRSSLMMNAGIDHLERELVGRRWVQLGHGDEEFDVLGTGLFEHERAQVARLRDPCAFAGDLLALIGLEGVALIFSQTGAMTK